MGDLSGSGAAEHANLWWFLATVALAMIGQAGLMIRARIKVNAEKKSGGGVADGMSDATKAAILLENKDNRAFQFLWDQLTQCKDSHKACEDNFQKSTHQIGQWTSTCEMALFNIEVLTNCLKSSGIPVPALPKLTRPQ